MTGYDGVGQTTASLHTLGFLKTCLYKPEGPAWGKVRHNAGVEETAMVQCPGPRVTARILVSAVNSAAVLQAREADWQQMSSVQERLGRNGNRASRLR